MEKKNHFQGLTEAEVLKSRAQHGVNILTPPEKESLWSKFLEKFEDPLIRILLVAGFLSIGIATKIPIGSKNTVQPCPNPQNS